MAAITPTTVEHIPGGIGPLTVIIAKLDVAASGDTWATGLRAITAAFSNDVAITKLGMTDGSGTLTITSTGAVSAARVVAIGYA